MERSFKRALTALDEVFGFLDEAMTVCGVDATSAYAVNFLTGKILTEHELWRRGMLT